MAIMGPDRVLAVRKVLTEACVPDLKHSPSWYSGG